MIPCFCYLGDLNKSNISLLSYLDMSTEFSYDKVREWNGEETEWISGININLMCIIVSVTLYDFHCVNNLC